MKNQNRNETHKSNGLISVFIYFVIFVLTFSVSFGITQFENIKHVIAPKSNTNLFEDQAYQLVVSYVSLVEYEDPHITFDRDSFLIIKTFDFKEYEQGSLGDFIVGFVDKYGDPKFCTFYLDRLLEDQCDW